MPSIPTSIICPNCNSVVPAGSICLQCKATLNVEGGAVLESITTAMLSLPEISPGDLQTVTTNINPDLDPRLQRIVANVRQGVRKLSTSSTGTDEVAVIAKVNDVAAWENLSEVALGGTIGPNENGEIVVTGRIPVARIEHVRQQPFVLSLKPAQRLTPVLHKTIEEIGCRPDLLPAGSLGDGGQEAIVGIIDFGCDFAHQNFLKTDGTSRILAIWNQSGPNTAESPFGYGKVHTRDNINNALLAANPYQALGYGPRADTIVNKGSHGTHVMDIAAGNGNGSGVPGVAPKSDIIFVEVASNDIPWDGEDVVGKSFGDSVQLLEAVKFIFDMAGDRPCVINVSLGTNGGPHDGSTLVEQGIDSLLTQAPNRALCLAASNSFSDGIHTAGVVQAGGTFDIHWEISSEDETSNEFELWYSGTDRIGVEVIAPNGSSLLKVNPGDNSQALKNGNRIVLLAANRLTDPNNQDNMIGIFLERGLPLGEWIIRLHGMTINDGSFHAWIERDDSGQSNFSAPNDNSHTIGSISCGHQTIVVGSYDAHKTTVPLSFFSSAGPTRDGREKPEVSAPGHAVLAAWSRTKNRVIAKSGTSMASPATAGTIALVLSEAHARGISLNSQQIREIIINAARKNPPNGAAWHPQYGHGRIFAAEAIEAVIALPPGPGTVVTNAVLTTSEPAEEVKPKSPGKNKPAGKKKKNS